MTEVTDPELIPILPIEASMSGRNSTYRFCDQREQFVSYAVCLHTLRRIEDNTLPAEIAVECQRGYCHNNCVAKVMKAEEVDAGHALYFKARPRHITDPAPAEERKSGAVSSGKFDMSSASYARGWAIGGGAGEQRDRPAPKKRTPLPPAPKPKSNFVEATGADLVNALMAESKKPAPAPIKPSTSTTMRPFEGESIPDFIKRRAAALKG